MEYLIRRGIPQRTAHSLVGRLVRKAMDRGCRLSDLTLQEFRETHADFDEGVYEVLGPAKAVEAMQSYGSTGPEQVRGQIERWKRVLGDCEGTAGSQEEPNPATAPTTRHAHA